MFQYFGQRLKRDLKQLVDRRLDASVLASGSVLKVLSYTFPRVYLRINPYTLVFRRRRRRNFSQTSTVRTYLGGNSFIYYPFF